MLQAFLYQDSDIFLIFVSSFVNSFLTPGLYSFQALKTAD
jgi:hypothetical protein